MIQKGFPRGEGNYQLSEFIGQFSEQWIINRGLPGKWHHLKVKHVIFEAKE